MACASSCKTQDHQTYGECMRAKNLRVADVGYTHLNKKHTRELSSYEKARKEGIQPQSTRQKDIDLAVRQSDKTGTAYRADE